jgi:hypothetical protein
MPCHSDLNWVSWPEHQLRAVRHLLVGNLVEHTFQVTDYVFFLRRQRTGKLDMLEEHDEGVADPAELLALAGNRQRIFLDRRVGRFPEIDGED